MRQLIDQPVSDLEWEEPSRRGLWTPRVRKATAIVAVLALVSGIAWAFLLFDRDIPGNQGRAAAVFDFEVHVERPARGCNFERAGPAHGDETRDWCLSGSRGPTEPIFRSLGALFPGESRTEVVRVFNRDEQADMAATVFLHIPPDSIRVTRCDDQGFYDFDDPEVRNGTQRAGDCRSQRVVVAREDPRWIQFVRYWRLDVERERVYGATVRELDPNFNANDDLPGVRMETPKPPSVGSVPNLPDPEEDNLEEWATRPSPTPNPSVHVPSVGIQPSDRDRAPSHLTSRICRGGIHEFGPLDRCTLGSVRAFGSTEPVRGQRLDMRWLHLEVMFLNVDEDQSEFKSWDVAFGMVFSARVPALPDPSLPTVER